MAVMHAALRTPTAYSYVRWSTPEQGDGHSLDRQLEAAEAYASRHGLSLDSRHRDEGVSSYRGRNHRKGALGAFLHAVAIGEVERGSHLLVEDLDRLSREHPLDAQALFTSIIRSGVTITTLKDGRSYSEESIRSNWTELLLPLATMGLANEESRKKSERVGKAHSASKVKARETGEVWHSTGPTWTVFNPATKAFDLLPEKVAVVRRIFDLLEAGMGTTAIAALFNREGVPTPKPTIKSKRTGEVRATTWHHSTVLEAAKNRSVIGEYQPKLAKNENRASRRPVDGPPVPNYYPAIIDSGQFHRVQAKIASRAPSKGRAMNAHTFNNLFIGMAICADCGGKIGYASAGQSARGVLRCQAAERHVCRNRTRYPYEAVERAILENVQEFDPTPPRGAKPKEALDLELALGAKAELEREARVSKKLLTLDEDDPIALADYTAATAALKVKNAEIARLEAIVSQAGAEKPPEARQAEIANLLTDLTTLEGDALYERRARLSSALRAVIDELRFFPIGERRGVALNKPIDLDGLIQVKVGKGSRIYWFRNGNFCDAITLLPRPHSKRGTLHA